mgnify:FL=1
MKLFHRNKKNDDSESDVRISEDTKDFRFIIPKDYPDADFGDINRQSDADFILKGHHDDRSSGYRDPLIDAHTEANKRIIQDHMSANIRMWRVIKSGAQAQQRRVESDLKFVDGIAAILNLGGTVDEENKKS